MAPWEAKIAEETGRKGVAESELGLLVQKREGAKQRLQVHGLTLRP